MQKVEIDYMMRGHILSDDIEDVEYVDVSEAQKVSGNNRKNMSYDKHARDLEIFEYSTKKPRSSKRMILILSCHLAFCFRSVPIGLMIIRSQNSTILWHVSPRFLKKSPTSKRKWSQKPGNDCQSFMFLPFALHLSDFTGRMIIHPNIIEPWIRN